MLNRREFLKASAAGTASLLGNADEARADPNASDILKGYTLTDQYGKAFDVAGTLGGKPFILVFGFNGCLQCQKISNALARVQEKLLSDGKDVPIVVLSIHPDQDKGMMEEYVNRYKEIGVRQTKGNGSFAEDKDKRPTERLMHILCAESPSKAFAIHDSLKLIRQRSSPNSHTGFLMVCDGKGEAKKKFHAAIGSDDRAQIDQLSREVSRTLGDLDRDR